MIYDRFKGVIKKFIFLLVSGLIFVLCACSNNTGRSDKKSDVEKLLDDAENTSGVEIIGIENLGNDTEEENSSYTVTVEITTEYPLATGPSQYVGDNGDINMGHGDSNDEIPVMDADPNADVDLTVLSSNMVYAEVYNMLMNPDDYLGKQIKVQGPYYPLFYEGTGKYYHYIMIIDALACCKNGIEFIWDEGVHIYPDEYPKEDDIIQITGTYGKYEEEGYTYYYLDIKEYEIVE